MAIWPHQREAQSIRSSGQFAKRDLLAQRECKARDSRSREAALPWHRPDQLNNLRHLNASSGHQSTIKASQGWLRRSGHVAAHPDNASIQRGNVLEPAFRTEYEVIGPSRLEGMLTLSTFGYGHRTVMATTPDRRTRGGLCQPALNCNSCAPARSWSK